MSKHPDKKKRRIMRAFKINEISGVDVPAQEGAVAVIMKRKDGIEKRALITSPEDGHSHLLRLDVGQGELTSGETNFVEDHTHPWIMIAGGEIVIGTARRPGGDPHIHRVAFMSKGDDEEEAKKQVAKDLLSTEAAAAALLSKEVGTEEDPMADKKIEKNADQAKVEDLQKQLVRANLIASLSDAEKTHLKGIVALEDEAAGEVFLAKSADERKAEVNEAATIAKRKADDADPVMYKTADGIDIKKSDGPVTLAMAKNNDELRKRLDKSEGIRVQDSFEKRAEEDLAHLPGTVAERAALIKAVDGIEDEGQRNAAMNALKAQNTAMATAFTVAGHGASPAPGSADDELDQLAKVYAKENKVSIEVASSEVLKTEEGRAIYAKMVH